MNQTDLLKSDFSVDAIPNRRELKELIDREILRSLDKSPSHLIAPALLKKATFPGRRLRPTLFLLLTSSPQLNASVAKPDLWRIAVAIEICHRASLLLDDLIDADLLRRGAPTFHAQYGTDLAILVSHQLVALTFSLLAEVRERYEAQFSSAYGRMCIGEEADTYNLPVTGSHHDFYSSLVLQKTSALFALLFQIAAEVTAQPKELQAIFCDLGERLGRLYQLYNDIYDDSYADLKERGYRGTYRLRVTLFSALALDHGKPAHRNLVQTCLSEEVSEADFMRARSVFRQPYLRRLAAEISAAELASLNQTVDAVPAGPWTETIVSFSKWIQQRNCWDQAIRKRAGY